MDELNFFFGREVALGFQNSLVWQGSEAGHFQRRQNVYSDDETWLGLG